LEVWRIDDWRGRSDELNPYIETCFLASGVLTISHDSGVVPKEERPVQKISQRALDETVQIAYPIAANIASKTL
jgi:hypothetical protein